MITIIHKKAKLGSSSRRKEKKMPEDEAVIAACAKFSQWLERAIAGDQFCYHEGTSISGIKVGKLAYRAYEHGKVVLVQKRGPRGFQYWAKRKPRWEG